MKKITFILLILCCILCGCKDKHKKQKQNQDQKTTVVLPAFSADSAYFFVKAQTDFGPRVMGSKAHELCKEYLVKKLTQYCDTVAVQSFTAKTFDGKKFSAQNIIGSFAPEKTKRIVLASHWDSRPFADHDPNPANHKTPIDGANDGASGVGVLLELARQLQKENPNIGVDIVFFDAEDYGNPEGVEVSGDWWGLGSQYWAKNPFKPNYTADYGILLDMVGADNARFLQEGISTHYAQDVVSKIWATAYELGYGNVFINEPGDMITDDHYYVNQYSKIKMIDIIHQDKSTGTGFGRVWHTMDDKIQNIDKNMLGIVGTTLRQVIINEK